MVEFILSEVEGSLTCAASLYSSKVRGTPLNSGGTCNSLCSFYLSVDAGENQHWQKLVEWIVLTTTCLPAGRYKMYNIKSLIFNGEIF
jgi:hypothetical protein